MNAGRSCGRTATPPATAWCRCRSPCRCRTTSGPRAPRCSWPTRWASTRRWWCTPRRWGRTSRSSSSTAAVQPPGRPRTRSRWSSATTRCSTPRRSTRAIKRELRRQLVVVGACIGTDAHTVGIDAILNIKGFAGEKGLEYYREIKVVNLGAQVPVPELVERAREAQGRRGAGVARWSRRRDAHLHNTREMAAAFREAYPGGQAPAAGRRRPALRRVDGRRARRGPDLRPGHDARRGGDLPGARARPPTRSTPHERRRRPTRPDGHPPPVRAVLPRPLRRQPGRRRLRRWGCSATSPPRCASAPTATRGCSRPTPTCSSSAPVRAGDVLEVTSHGDPGGARGHARSTFEARVICRAQPEVSASSAAVLDPPLVVTDATGTVVVP